MLYNSPPASTKQQTSINEQMSRKNSEPILQNNCEVFIYIMHKIAASTLQNIRKNKKQNKTVISRL